MPLQLLSLLSLALLSSCVALGYGGQVQGNVTIGDGEKSPGARVRGFIGFPANPEGIHNKNEGELDPGPPRGLLMQPRFQAGVGNDAGLTSMDVGFGMDYGLAPDPLGAHVMLNFVGLFGLEDKRHGFGPELRVGVTGRTSENLTSRTMSFVSVDLLIRKTYGDNNGWVVGGALSFDRIDWSQLGTRPGSAASSPNP